MITFLFSSRRRVAYSLIAVVSLVLAAGSRADTPDPRLTLGQWAGDLKVGPGMNAAGRNLRGCEFVGQDLSRAVFDGCDLHGVLFWDCILDGASFKRADLSDVVFDSCPSIVEADFTDAVVTGIRSTMDLSPDQLMSTRSYKKKDLRGCFISGHGRGGRRRPQPAYDFRGADLTGARIREGDFSACDFTDAVIDRVMFDNCTMTSKQLASTKNFKNRNLSHIVFQVRLDGDADFSGMDLSGSELLLPKTRPRLHDAAVRGCTFASTLVKEELYATKDYRRGDLTGITFLAVNMSGWDFAGRNLTRCRFERCNLAGAKLDDAVVSEVDFGMSRDGGGHLTLDQIKSTWNYKHGRMEGIQLPKPIADALEAERRALRDKNEKGK